MLSDIAAVFESSVCCNNNCVTGCKWMTSVINWKTDNTQRWGFDRWLIDSVFNVCASQQSKHLFTFLNIQVKGNKQTKKGGKKANIAADSSHNFKEDFIFFFLKGNSCADYRVLASWKVGACRPPAIISASVVELKSPLCIWGHVTQSDMVCFTPLPSLPIQTPDTTRLLNSKSFIKQWIWHISPRLRGERPR